jgi:hypothetical protein
MEVLPAAPFVYRYSRTQIFKRQGIYDCPDGGFYLDVWVCVFLILRQVAVSDRGEAI